MSASSSRSRILRSCGLSILSFASSYATLCAIGYLVSPVGVAGLSLAMVLAYWFRERQSPWWRKSLWVGGMAAMIPALLAVSLASQL